MRKKTLWMTTALVGSWCAQKPGEVGQFGNAPDEVAQTRRELPRRRRLIDRAPKGGRDPRQVERGVVVQDALMEPS